MFPNEPNPNGVSPRTASIGLLLVGHGTRDAAGRGEFLATSHLVADRWPGPVEPCFLELAEPSIEAGLERLVEQGCQRVVVAPLLLFAAGHAKRDVPDAVAAAAESHPGLEWRQAEHLGCHSALVELSAMRFQEALGEVDGDAADGLLDDGELLDEFPDDGVDLGGGGDSDDRLKNAAPRPTVAALCSDPQPPAPSPQLLPPHPSTLLILVGRGSLDATATAEMQQFARQRLELTPVGASEVCFAAMAEPRLADCLAQVVARRTTDLTGIMQVVVQPHLLFAGELLATIRQTAARSAIACPQWDWLITEHLGPDDLLAQAIVQRAEAAALGWKSATPKATGDVERQ